MSEMASPLFTDEPLPDVEPRVQPQQAPTPPPRRDLSQMMPLEEPVDDEQKNLSRIMDVVLHVSVELGRARMTVRQILDLDQDSVIELDRLAGEVVDVFVNEHLIARGEVVVVDDKFGVRISELISPTRIAGGFMFDLFSDSSASTFWLIVKVFLNLGLVILLIYTALSVARRLKLGTFGQANKQLSLLETLYLAPKQKIHLVRIGKKVLLIGATDDRLTVLTEEIDLASTETLLSDANEVAEEKPSSQTWSPRAFWDRWLAALNPRFNIMRHHAGE